jgi:hypothetical protein
VKRIESKKISVVGWKKVKLCNYWCLSGAIVSLQWWGRQRLFARPWRVGEFLYSFFRGK